MKVTGIYSKGYAAATTGGISYILDIEVAKDRFPDIDTPCIALVVPVNNDRSISPRLVSRLVSDSGRVSHWGGYEELTPDETLAVMRFVWENSLIDDAANIRREYFRRTKAFEKAIDDQRSFIQSLKRPTTLEELEAQIRKREELGKKVEEAHLRLEELKDIKP